MFPHSSLDRCGFFSPSLCRSWRWRFVGGFPRCHSTSSKAHNRVQYSFCRPHANSESIQVNGKVVEDARKRQDVPLLTSHKLKPHETLPSRMIWKVATSRKSCLANPHRLPLGKIHKKSIDRQDSTVAIPADPTVKTYQLPICKVHLKTWSEVWGRALFHFVSTSQEVRSCFRSKNDEVWS